MVNQVNELFGYDLLCYIVNYGIIFLLLLILFEELKNK